MQSAYRLAEDMELTAGDYLIIEKNLKYKKGRAGVLALLRKQEPAALRQACMDGCLTRLDSLKRVLPF